MSLDYVDILFVEDDKETIGIVAETFRGTKCNICQVESVDDAVDFLKAEGKFTSRSIPLKPKVIVVDFLLHNGSGLELIDEVRKFKDTKFIPIVMLTDSVNKDDIQNSYISTVNSFVNKPHDKKDLKQAVQRICSYWTGFNSLPYAV
jgi:CheY-like chemotaxis protein